MKDITLYTSIGCSQCLALKRWLEERSLSFKERDLSDTDVMSDLVMSDIFIMSAPALEIDGKFYSSDEIFNGEGLDESLLEEDLGLK